jgi:hypothetical protein
MDTAGMAGACLAQRPGACVPREQALSQRLLAVGAPPAAWAAVVVAAGWAHAWARAGQPAAAGDAAQRAAAPPAEAVQPPLPLASCASPGEHAHLSARFDVICSGNLLVTANMAV